MVFILLLIGGINLYRTFALYEEKKEFNVLRGRVPKFGTKIQYYLDDIPQEDIPEKDAYGVKVSCDQEVAYSWDYDEWKLNLPKEVKTITCEVKFYTMPDNFSGYIMKLSFFDDSVVVEDHAATFQTPALTDYRYIGASPNNYVCLEEIGDCKTEDGEIDENMLYRIIGVIPTQSRVPSEENPNEEIQYENRVKLISAISYGNFPWSGSGSNTKNDWYQSTLNTSVLNQTYWNSISNYHKYIDDTKWFLGAYYDTDNTKWTPATFYAGERGNTGAGSAKTTIYIVSPIGLLYPSDYGYATSGGATGRETCLGYAMSSGYWGSTRDNTYKQCRENDWLIPNSGYLWTITTGVSSSDTAWVVRSGDVYSGYRVYNNSWAVHPIFHLKSNVEYNGGDGTYNNPYRIKIKS